VDWYPWGQEAFDAAQHLDRPIFLSIGYATCHWCHVMEQESFEDASIAKELNATFICIKVDREELPEIDSIYMEFAQSMMSGATGWPLNMILTPALQPFFAATYLPAHTLNGMVGLSELIKQIRDVWTSEERKNLELQSAQIVEIFAEHQNIGDADEIYEVEELHEALDFIFKNADPVNGGMKGAPKFPLGYHINFMLNYSAKAKESRALFLAERSLQMMHRGGIYDHLAGGFSRYSTDEKWLLPHFEKMLYDNSFLATAYFEAWKVTKRLEYRNVAEEVVDYILKEMTHSLGGFYSALDADSEGKEGYYYTWRYEEVQKLLGASESRLFCDYYDITEAGNFEGRNILHTNIAMEEFAKRKGFDPLELEALFAEQRNILAKARLLRIPPLKDDKILCSWNGLMIATMAKVVHHKEIHRYSDAAVKAAHFLKEHLWKNGILLRRWRDGEACYEGSLEDYAFLTKGCLALFEANRGSVWLEWALELVAALETHFHNDLGGYYQTSEHQEHIILRKCYYSDGAEPSGNGVHCENLMKLYQITGNDVYLERAERILKAVTPYIEKYPSGYCYHLMNITRYHDKNAATLVIALNSDNHHQEALFEVINNSFIPHKSVVWVHQKDALLLKLIPDLKHQIAQEDKTTLYICHQGVCKKPLTSFSEMLEAIALL